MASHLQTLITVCVITVTFNMKKHTIIMTYSHTVSTTNKIILKKTNKQKTINVMVNNRQCFHLSSYRGFACVSLPAWS